MITTLTGKNQVTVPAEIVKEMQLERGSRFEWTLGERPGVIVIEVKPSKSQLLKRVQELGKSCKRDLIQELIDERNLDMLEE